MTDEATPISDKQAAITQIRAEVARLTQLIDEYRDGVTQLHDDYKAKITQQQVIITAFETELTEAKQYIQVLEHETRELKRQIHPAGG